MPEELPKSPLLLALMDKRVKAEVVDLDHYRIRGGMAVETDYIIRVSPSAEPKGKDPQFEPFTLSKTYSAFRTLGQQLKKAADVATSSSDPLPVSVQKLAQYCETVIHLVEAQRTQYLGKVNYNYVRAMAKKRSQIITETLEATLSYFPNELVSHPFHSEVSQIVETFFLLDHCVEDDRESVTSLTNVFKVPKKYSSKQKEQVPGTVTTQATSTTSMMSDRSKDKPAVEQPLEKVGAAVGGAMDQVGNFLKQTLGGADEAKERTLPAPIDTSMSVGIQSLRSPVVPYTRKSRRSVISREQDDKELKEMGEEANLLLDDERPVTEFVPSYSHPMPTFLSRGTKVGDLLETNPMIFSLIFLASATALKHAAKLTISMDFDIMLLLIWASFCIGLHTPRPMVGGIDKIHAPPPMPPTTPGNRMMRKQDRHGRQLLRMSMVSTPDAAKSAAAAAAAAEGNLTTFDDIRQEDEQDEFMEVGQSPLPKFPDDAELGSVLNCWSEPVAQNFRVRGDKYLQDKRKVESGPFLFPVRAVDLFLTDTCPQNAGSNSGVLGGTMREKPTFLINFRLPWGILLAYFEIPERFIPFVRAGHEEGFDKSTLPSLDDMTPGERCAARFLQNPSEEKNKTMKIIPMVVEGPWVVKSVVGGKPAIIGNKLPVEWCYQKEEGDKAMYLEADLDIVSSSAARGILSVTRTYTQVLTLDMGFVVQGNTEDELPEQMLVGARLHGIDPLTAPPYPPSKDMFVNPISESGEESGDEL